MEVVRSLNRTNVELKLKWNSVLNRIRVRLNRTNVELKFKSYAIRKLTPFES